MRKSSSKKSKKNKNNKKRSSSRFAVSSNKRKITRTSPVMTRQRSRNLQTTTIDDLPPEVLEHVLQNLHGRELLTTAKVSKDWQKATKYVLTRPETEIRVYLRDLYMTQIHYPRVKIIPIVSDDEIVDFLMNPDNLKSINPTHAHLKEFLFYDSKNRNDLDFYEWFKGLEENFLLLGYEFVDGRQMARIKRTMANLHNSLV